MSAGRLMTALVAAGTVATVAFALRPATDAPAAPTLRLSSPTGEVRITNSKEGEALLEARDWVPGEVARGRVAIENSGGAHQAVELTARRIVDVAAAGGATLSPLTRVQVARKRSVLGLFKVVFDGTLRKLRNLDVGDWPAGGTRYFRLFAVPEPRAGEANELQGAAMSFAFRWRAEAQSP